MPLNFAAVSLQFLEVLSVSPTISVFEIILKFKIVSKFMISSEIITQTLIFHLLMLYC